MSLATTKELPLIKEDNCEIFNIFSSSNIDIPLILLVSLISEGPGATTILYLSLYLFFISSIN